MAIRHLFIASLFALSLIDNAQATPPGPISPLAPKALALAAPNGVVTPKITAAEHEDIIAALEGLRGHGVNPERFHLKTLKTYGAGGEMGLYAVDAWMSAADTMLNGALDPVSVEPDWTVGGRQDDLLAIYKAARAAGTLAQSLEALAPQQSAYKAMKTELAGLRARSAESKAYIAPGPALKKGTTDIRVQSLQDRLAQLGFLTNSEATGNFNAATESALKAFQRAYDLDDDGVAGAGTINTLNRGVQEKIDALRVNMERFRWLPEDLGRRHLRANIANFNVTAYNQGVAERTHLTIVGKPYRSTPVFSDAVSYIVFNPWWETPPSLARRDKLPAFKKDISTIDRLGFQVIDKNNTIVDGNSVDWNAIPAGTMPYRLRQAPGPTNALGQVKIMFPNKHNVYLHDTPQRGLFAQKQRAFSSGCMRTQDPLDLSAWLLSETPGWDKARIESAVASGKETRANLQAKVPVHILYMTVTTSEGGVHYLDDIYSRDQRVLAALDKP